MHPPNHICKALERLHPQLRLGWVGHDRGEDESLNKGCFALLQLYHTRDSDRTFYTHWDSRGPVFGKDYDHLMRVPIYLSDLDPQDVFSGKVIPMVRRWMQPMRERYMKSAQEKGRAYEANNQELAEGAADYMLWHANHKGGNSDRTITNSDITEQDKAVLRGDTKKDLTEAFTKVSEHAAPLV